MPIPPAVSPWEETLLYLKNRAFPPHPRGYQGGVADYYYLDAHQQPQGPLELEALKTLQSAGTIGPDTLAAEAGGAGWVPLSHIVRLASLPPPPPTAPKNGLALASLILGCLGFLCGFLTGIPAVITGVLALAKNKKESKHPQAQTFAITGIVLGCCSLFFTALLAGLAVPAITMASQKAHLMKDMADARQVHALLLQHAIEHGGAFPNRLEDVFNVEALAADPARTTEYGLFYEKGSVKLRWELTPGLTTSSPVESVLFQSVKEIKSGSHTGKIFVSVGGMVDYSGNPDYQK